DPAPGVGQLGLERGAGLGAVPERGLHLGEAALVLAVRPLEFLLEQLGGVLEALAVAREVGLDPVELGAEVADLSGQLLAALGGGLGLPPRVLGLLVEAGHRGLVTLLGLVPRRLELA